VSLELEFVFIAYRAGEVFTAAGLGDIAQDLCQLKQAQLLLGNFLWCIQAYSFLPSLFSVMDGICSRRRIRVQITGRVKLWERRS
jgi:hypothetical protein